MWKILQNKKPGDFVIATGEQYSVKEFVNFVLEELLIKFKWKEKELTLDVMITMETVLLNVIK